MLPELGSFAIILALCFALLQSIVPLTRARLSITLANTAAISQLVFLSFAMLCLILAFLMNDLSVIYVREHSHTLLPFIYRFGAAWGGHEGSLLLWCLILAGWTTAFILFADPALDTPSRRTIVMVLGFISSGFLIFLLSTSNPFQRDFPTQVINGNDLTAILQDPGLIFHPPMLYFGYVGFAIGFAFAISALLEGQLTAAWAKACRPWVMLPWAFLSCGIVLGSWWAYRELGWGGWWFWDPVENASLLPWLAATGFLHSLIVCEKRDNFKGWTLLLAIITFTLSLLGTFLVRSGVLVSVHTFANDPTRGLFLLGYLAIIISGALLLYAIRIARFYRAPDFALFSRETVLLLNSILLLTAALTILLGTLYPIILDALGNNKISIGEPYFNMIFTPLMLLLLFLMGLAPHLRWKEQTNKKYRRIIYRDGLLSFALSLLLPTWVGFPLHVLATAGITAALWVTLSTLDYSYQLIKARKAWERKHWAMITAHLGIAMMALGITVNKTYSTERQVKILPGETVQLAGYQFTLANVEEVLGANYKSITATFDIQQSNHAEQLIAEQRIYQSHQETLSKPGISANLWRDLYLALGNSFPDGGWAVRIYYKPLVRWIWAGGFLLLFSGFFSLLTYWKNRGSRD